MTISPTRSVTTTTRGAVWNDLPRRFLTVGVGVPCIAAALRSPVASFLFFQGAHILCLWEWARLVPPPAGSSDGESSSQSPSAAFEDLSEIEKRREFRGGRNDEDDSADKDSDFVVVDDRNEERPLATDGDAVGKERKNNFTAAKGVSVANREAQRKEATGDSLTEDATKRRHDTTQDNIEEGNSPYPIFSKISLSTVTLVSFSFLSIIQSMIPSQYLPPSLMLSSVALRFIRHCPDNGAASRSNINAVADHCQFGLMYVTLGFHYLLRVSQFGGPSHIGFLLFVVWMADTGALVVGRTMKKKRGKVSSEHLAKNLGNDFEGEASIVGNVASGMSYAKQILRSISPGKTTPGLVGSILTGLVAAAMWPGSLPPFCACGPEVSAPSSEESPTPFVTDVCFSHFDGFARSWHANIDPLILRCMLGVLLAAAGILGDLAESSVKRTARRKDSGGILPGHGGILDRFDSLFISAALYYYCVLG